MNKPASWAWLPIAIPILALFGPALATDSSFAMRDAGHFYHPLFEWCGREWAAGRVPLWNPYENCGLPVLADTTSSLFYPGKLLFLLPVDFALRYKLYIVLHVLLAAAGSYGLARAWKCSPAAAAIAAIAYACGGNVAFQYCNAVFLVGAAWLPWAALAADRLLTRGSWRAAGMLGVVLALMILGGDPQAALHGLLITGLYALVLWFQKPAAEARAGEEPRSRVGALTQVLLIGSAAVLAYLLAAVQAIPAGEATKLSERAAFNRPRNIYEVAAVALQPADSLQPLGEKRNESIARGLFGAAEEGSHHDLVYDFSVGPWRLAEYFWPNLGGRMFPTNRRWLSLLPAEGRTWTPTLYLGLLPIVLAISVLRLRGGSPRERWLSWLVLLFTLASFGYYGLGWLLQELRVLSPASGKTGVAPPVGGVYWLLVTFLPTYVYFRYPAKLLPLVSLGLSQLAARGFDRAFVEQRPRLAKVLLALGTLSGACAFVAWFVGEGLFSQVTKGDSSLGPFDARGAYRDLLFAFVQTMLVALASRWLLQKHWAESSPKPTWQMAAVVLTGLELAFANAWLVVTAPADLWRTQSPVAQSIRATAPAQASSPPPRVYRGNLASWRPPSFRQAGSANRPAETVQWERDTLFPKHELPSALALVESYGSIKLIDYESLLFVAKQHGPLQPDKSLLPQPTALRLLGTEYLILPDRQSPDFAELLPATGERWPASATLRKMTRTLPRAWIVHDVQALPPLPRPYRIEAVDQRTKAVLFPGNKARNFLRTAVVETEQPLPEWNPNQSEKSLSASGGQSSEPCRITHYDPQRVVVEAVLERPGLLVLSDAWFPGWQARVTTGGSSHEAPIYRSNRVLRGVWLPAGASEVEYRFLPASFVRGACISASAWSIVAIVGLIVFIKGRRTRLAANSGTRLSLTDEAATMQP